MTRLGDDRIHFYLRNKEQIDEWAAVGEEAAAAVGEWLTTLRRDVADVAEDLGSDVDAAEVEVSRGGVFLMKLAAWPLDTEQDPLVGIGLAWDREPFLNGERAPYSGIRVSYKHDRADALRTAVRAAVAEAGPAATGYERSNMWVVWRRHRAATDYWLDPDAYRQQVRAALAQDWQTFRECVDGALETWE